MVSLFFLTLMGFHASPPDAYSLPKLLKQTFLRKLPSERIFYYVKDCFYATSKVK
jgi:hypothetical protein